MKCPKCQHENPDDAKFCNECATELELVCPECGKGNPPGSKFCNGCAHALSTLSAKPTPKELSFDEKLNKIQRYLPRGLTEKILAQRDKIEGERKQVTVMFCDMEGFTPLVDKIGPEEAYAIMDQVYEILIHKVHGYGGTINEMTGDGIMALFGAPIAMEDAPQRAIRSAYAIHREMAALSDGLREKMEDIPTIRMRVGIHTGPVVVGTLGNDLRVEFKAVGDTVNLAARVQSLAEPGSTLVTADLFRLAEGLFRFEALGEKSIKGKRDPVSVYRVIAPSGRRTRFDVSAERGLTRLVGRERELELLLDGFERSKGGRGQVFSIMSEAGLGKSRLLYEFRKAVINENATFLEGRCLSYSKGVAYHPIIDILKSNFNIQEGDPDSEIKRKVRAGLTILGADEESNLPYVLELLSVKDSGIDTVIMTPEGKKERTLETLKRIVLRGSQIRPLIMAIEDLHWVDKTSEGALKDLLEYIPRERVFLLFTYRPDYGVHNWSSKSYHNQINLNRLSNRESIVMASHFLGAEHLERNLENVILEKTEGIPFFIEEFLRSLLGLGLIERRGSEYQFRSSVQTIRIPSTIHDVIMARVDALPQTAKEVLQAGSVIEREFSYGLIRRVTGLPEHTLLSCLSVLKDSELLYERGIYPESTYIFKHALTQEVVNGSILTRRRKELHEVVGDAIEDLYGKSIEEYYGILANHFIESENYEKAAGYCKRGGEKADRSGSVNEAIEYAKKRILCLESLPRDDSVQSKAIEIRTVLALRLLDVNFFLEAQDAIAPLDERSPAGSSSKTVSLLLTVRGTLEFCLREDFSKAFEHLEQALRVSQHLGDLPSLAAAEYWLGYALSSDCQFEEASKHIQNCLRYNTDIKHLSRISAMKSLLSYLAYYLRGDMRAAYQVSQEAVRIAEESGDVFSKTFAHSCHGISSYGRGFLEEAKSHLTTGLGFAGRIDHHYWQPADYHFLGEMSFEAGQHQQAMGYFNRAIRHLEQYAYLPSWLNLNRIALARVNAISAGKAPDVEEVKAYVSRNKVRQYEGWMRRLVGEVLSAGKQDNSNSGEEWIKLALVADQNNGMMFELGKDYLLYARYLKRRNEGGKSLEYFRKATEIFAECDADGWVTKTREEMGN